MILNREEEFEDKVKKFLSDKLEIYPFSVTNTNEFDNGGLLSITFFINSDLDTFLDKIDYKSQCDKSGFLILSDNDTVILTGMALISFYTKIILN